MVLDLAPGLQWRTRLASVGAGQLSVRRKCQMCSREIAFLWHLHMPVLIYLHNDKASLFVRPGRYPGPPHKQRYARYDGAADDTSCGSQMAAVSNVNFPCAEQGPSGAPRPWDATPLRRRLLRPFPTLSHPFPPLTLDQRQAFPIRSLPPLTPQVHDPHNGRTAHRGREHRLPCRCFEA